MLKQISVPIDSLFLDPNNPRFISDLSERVTHKDSQIEKQQSEILKKFVRSTGPNNPDDDVTNIRSLYESMIRMGFVAVDRIVVRLIAGSPTKFLVLEGNRRIATVKTILADYEAALPPLGFGAGEDRDSVTEKLASFTTIPAMQLEVSGLSQKEIDQKVAIILGIRHHGSLLGWDPLPRAFNIFSQYMEEKPKVESFVWKNLKGQAIRKRLSIGLSEVESALRTYQAYLQIRTIFPDVKENHFSLIEAAVQNKTLKHGYFNIDQETFQLNDASLTKLNLLCQFATRDSQQPLLTTALTKKICPHPKAFGALGNLVNRMQSATHQVIKEFAAELLKRVENEDDLEMTIDQARADLSKFEKRINWATAIGELLIKQRDKLNIGDYSGDGLELARKTELKNTFENLRKLLGL